MSLSLHDLDVDVVMPCAGNANYFEEALDSALNQTLTPNCIYVIDNSNNSIKYKNIVDSKHSNLIKYIKLPRRISMTENWQYCLGIGTSTYFAFLHDDDIWEKNYIEAAMAAMKTQSLDKTSIVLTAHYFFQSNEGKNNIPQNQILEKTKTFQLYNTFPKDVKHYILSTCNACHMSALVFKRAAIGFPIHSRFMPDQWFLASYLCLSNVVLVPKVNSYIRLSPGNVTSSMNRKGFVSVEIIQHLRSVTDTYIRTKDLTARDVVDKLDISYTSYIKRLKQACFSWPLNPYLLQFGADLIKEEALLNNKKLPKAIIKLKSLYWILLCIAADISYFLRDVKDK